MKTFITILLWALRIFVSYRLFKTAYVKLAPVPGAVSLFTMLKMEPRGRILMGIVELLTAILILFPRTTGVAALVGVGSMGVVIFFHLTKLGVSMNGDSSLFILAVSIFMASLVLVIFEHKTLMNYLSI